MQELIENYYVGKPEPLKGALLSIREIILAFDDQVTESWKYSMPFFLYRKKMFIYLYQSKTSPLPYLGICDGKHFEHPLLQVNGRSRMKILPFNPEEDLPIESIQEVLKLGKSYLDKKLG